MSKGNKFGFAFFLSFYISAINSFKPESGWQYTPEIIDALVPAVGALLAHITVVITTMLRIPSEEQVSSAVTLFRHKRKIKKQLKDPMLSEQRRARLLLRYEQACDKELDAFSKIEPASNDDKKDKPD